MYVNDVLDRIKIIFAILFAFLGLVFAVFFGWKVIQNLKLQIEADSIKTKLEIENLKLDNELKKIQLEELGFDFTEESKQIEEK